MTETFEKYLHAIRHYCDYQERCHQEVRYKLVELGARGEVLEQLISMMITEGLLNEERYAGAYARGKFRVNRWGRIRIIRQLQQKNVSEYCIKKGLLEIDAEAYEQTVADLITQKYATLKQEKHPALRRQKAIRFLLQKGFEYDIILSVMNRLDLP
jgi:regulatory protein